jgi:hypothetical protein
MCSTFIKICLTFLNSITFLKKKSITENLDICLVFYCFQVLKHECDLILYMIFKSLHVYSFRECKLCANDTVKFKKNVVWFYGV